MNACLQTWLAVDRHFMRLSGMPVATGSASRNPLVLLLPHNRLGSRAVIESRSRLTLMSFTPKLAARFS